MRVRGGDLLRMPAFDLGHERADRETVVGGLAAFEGLVLRRGRVDLALDAVVVLDVERKRVQRSLPTHQVERVVAQRHPGDEAAGVLNLHRVAAFLVDRAAKHRSFDLGFDDRGGHHRLPLRIQVAIGPGDRPVRLHQEQERGISVEFHAIGDPFGNDQIVSRAEFQIAEFG